MNCPHHIMWIVEREHGLHQCIQCQQVVTRKDVTPRFEDLGPLLQQRWQAHETSGQPAVVAATPG